VRQPDSGGGFVIAAEHQGRCAEIRLEASVEMATSGASESGARTPATSNGEVAGFPQAMVLWNGCYGCGRARGPESLRLPSPGGAQ
jgi:hypothetical protein